MSATWRALLARVRAAATRTGRAASGEFAAEGTRLLERALRAGVAPRAVLGIAGYGAEPRERAVLLELEACGVPVVFAPEEARGELVGARTFGSVAALLPLPERSPLATAAWPRGDVLAAVDVQDPGNVGALVRTAAAAGAAAFVAVGPSDPFHPKAVRTSMGAVFKLPVLECESVDRLFDALAAAGLPALAAVARGGRAPWEEPLALSESGHAALLLGSEAHGLADDVVARCADSWTLPQSGELDSYSVNAAAAMLLYELLRRRRPGRSAAAPDARDLTG